MAGDEGERIIVGHRSSALLVQASTAPEETAPIEPLTARLSAAVPRWTDPA